LKDLKTMSTAVIHFAGGRVATISARLERLSAMHAALIEANAREQRAYAPAVAERIQNRLNRGRRIICVMLKCNDEIKREYNRRHRELLGDSRGVGA
jgi:hypothetical protein